VRWLASNKNYLRSVRKADARQKANSYQSNTDVIFETYARMWPLIIGIVALVIAIMGLIWRVRVPRFERPSNPAACCGRA